MSAVYYTKQSVIDIAEYYFFRYLDDGKRIEETPLYQYEQGDKSVIQDEEIEDIISAIELAEPTATLTHKTL